MSRVAGILYAGGLNQRAPLVSKMISRQSNDQWQQSFLSNGNASFGWCGWYLPNCSDAQSVIAVVDGHIYNRDELDNGTNDAELLISLYKRYGFQTALSKINGDFSVALYDPKIDTLWLGRDRFGVKPLYYVDNSELFAFASRPSALLTLPAVSKEVNRQFVALYAGCHYRYFDNRPEESPYKDIGQVPASTILTINKGRVIQKKFWELANLEEFTEPESELSQQYRDLLLKAVTLRLKSANKPAFTLSGGMDSSSVLASAVEITNKKQHAFSTVYQDRTYDESNEILSMLDKTVKQWHPIKIDIPDVFSIIEEMIDIHDEPVATATWLSHYLLCKEVAAKGFAALFGGLGGDELNAGEYEYFLFHFADLKSIRGEDRLEEEIKFWIKYHNHPIFKKSSEVAKDSLHRVVNLNNPGECLPDRARIERYANTLNRDFFDIKSFVPIMDHPFKSYLKNRTYQDIYRETIPCCLRAEDRQTAAYGIDNFLPFYDHHLVEFMFRISGTLKIRKGVTKYLLREAMKDILPEETRTRVKKSGWNAPAHIWFSGKGSDILMDMVNSRCFRERGIYNVKEVIKVINEHKRIVSSNSVQDNHMMFLWQLVNMEIWLNKLGKNGKA